MDARSADQMQRDGRSSRTPFEFFDRKSLKKVESNGSAVPSQGSGTLEHY
jgi:hypothetical protein